MPTAFETLVKILKLEQNTGNQDHAVITGLNSYVQNWQADAHEQAKKQDHHLLIDEIVDRIDAYSSQSPEARRQSIKYILDRITGRTPAPEGLVAKATYAIADPRPAEQKKLPTSDSRDESGDEDSRDRAERFPKRNKPSRKPERRGAVDRSADRSDDQEHFADPNSTPNVGTFVVDEPPKRNGKNKSFIALGDPVNDGDASKYPQGNSGETPSPNYANTREEIFPKPVAARIEREVTTSGRPEDQDDTLNERIPALPYRKQEALRTMRTQRRRNFTRDRRLEIETARALKSPVTTVDGVGPKIAEKLEPLGLKRLEDIFYNFPRRYDDYTQMLPLSKLLPGMTVTVIGEVRSVGKFKGKRGQDIINVTIEDGTGTLSATFFGATWLFTKFERGMQVVFSGKVELYLGKISMNQPEWEALEKEALHTRAIVPVYRLTKGLTAHMIRKITYNALNRWSIHYPDYLPDSVLERMNLDELGWAIRQLHFPESMETLAQSQRRLAFDELLLLQLAMLGKRHVWQSQPGIPMPIDPTWIEQFLASLPYPLTGAQRRALNAIAEDMAQPIPMNRLLQGDVGAGKTVVAATAMGIAIASGHQAAIMAPTGILAEQHFKSISRLLKNGPNGENINVKLLTGATPAQERAEILWGLGEGSVNAVVGTHALFQDDVNFWNLGLAVIDEQHRFGVEQRGKLRGKGTNPHVLVMTATPIPRTLALTVYADLDLTILDEMPPGRSPIETVIMLPNERSRAYGFIARHVEKGRQAFIVYPLVEASESESMSEVKSAVEDFQRLQREIFPEFRLGLLHGKMSPSEKEAAMLAFSKNETQILVCTSVVEVGIDVPNATVIMIESANRFGLAQLHQFRGRVGRGQYASTCLLLPDDGNLENERLKAMESTTDGFKLAEMDLAQRGAGDLLGDAQSGGSNVQSLMIDLKLVEEAQLEARTLFEIDPEFRLPEHELLRARIFEKFGAPRDSGDVS